MSKVLNVAAGLAVVPMLAFAAPVFADSPGQLQGGSNTFVVKNVTTTSAYGSSAQVNACNDVIQYSVELHNTEYGALSNVNVKATLGATTTVTATPAQGASAGVTASVKVNGLTDGRSLSYVANSAKLYGADGKETTGLTGSDVTAGVTVDQVKGSDTKFVNFQAKVTCETPAPKQIQVCDLNTKKVITINESDFNSKTQSKDLTKCQSTPTTPTTPTTPSTPTTLVNTGAGNVVAIFAAVAVVAAAAYNFVLRRQNAR